MSSRNSRVRGVWVVAGVAVGLAAWSLSPVQAALQSGAQEPGTQATAATAPGASDAKRGEYLVNAAGCGDCHTPMKMGASGPEPDNARRLSGHDSSMKLPPAPAASGPWITSVAATMTAWSGPWGTSYTANLTPDPETGLGKWTEQQFIDSLRSGRHQGRGRQILPPMPWQAIRNFNDADLKAIFAYLKTIPAVKNRVPDPLPPAGK